LKLTRNKRGFANQLRNKERAKTPVKWKQMGLKSGSEGRVAEQLAAAGIDVRKAYEAVKIPYRPDFVLPNGIIIEVKGLWETADRAKIRTVLKLHPKLDIRFVFDNPNAKIYPGAASTYGDWCGKHGIQYAKCSIPIEWLTEPKNASSISAIDNLS
jgi:hypothetical protein